MPGRTEKTIFISYRRTNFWTALAVFKELHSNGFDVFFDYRSIPSGDFEQVITENVKSRAHFIVILSPSALDRCNEPGDWFRREVETAIDNHRNIIPLMMEGFDFGSPATVIALTGKLTDLKKYNAMSIPAEYFDDAMTKLRSERFLNRPLEYVSHPVSDTTKQITEKQKSAAIKAPAIDKEQLSAQEWFEQGRKYEQNNNPDEAIRCYSEAIKIKADYADAYSFRGMVRAEQGDFDAALQDCTEAIKLNPIPDTYFFRGYTRAELGDLAGAIDDFTEGILLDPDAADGWYERGLYYEELEDFEKAIQDFDEAIHLKPDHINALVARGRSRYGAGNLESALLDFNQAILIQPEAYSIYLSRAELWEDEKDYSKAISDYQKYLELGGGTQETTQLDIEERIKRLKANLTKKKSASKKSSTKKTK